MREEGRAREAGGGEEEKRKRQKVVYGGGVKEGVKGRSTDGV